MERTAIILYLTAVNILAFSMFGADKQKARRRKWRISENTLMLLALAGGSVGAWLGMQLFHHKTKHFKFKVGIPVIFLLQVLAVSVWIYQM